MYLNEFVKFAFNKIIILCLQKIFTLIDAVICVS